MLCQSVFQCRNVLVNKWKLKDAGVEAHDFKRKNYGRKMNVVIGSCTEMRRKDEKSVQLCMYELDYVILNAQQLGED